MAKQATSKSRIRQLNRRQRKKLHLAEFQQLMFKLSVGFHTPQDGVAHDILVNEFIDLVQSRELNMAGMGGRFPLTTTEAWIVKIGHGSPTVDDQQALLAWLLARPEVAYATADALYDSWYDH